MTNLPKKLRTTDIEPDEHMLIKPGELIDIVELSPLTLQDRRIYNLLILNAWDSITEPKEHRIHKRDLRGTHHTSERVGDSLLRLMGAVAQLHIERDAGEGDGLENFTRRIQLLAGTEESAKGNGLVFYSFPAAIRGIIRESSQYARLQKQVMFAFSSKYALALYEMVQKRGNLKYKTSEEFDVNRFRSLLGVEDGKLVEFKSFKQRAIDPAVLEVNGLGEFGCKVEPVYEGRKVKAVRLSWWAKNLAERKASLNELRFSRVGRRARLKGEVVSIAGVLPVLTTPPQYVADDSLLEENQRPRPPQYVADSHKNSSDTQKDRKALTERELTRFRKDFPGLDIDWFEREFRAWNAERGVIPSDYVKAFYGFMKRKKSDQEAFKDA